MNAFVSVSIELIEHIKSFLNCYILFAICDE